MEKKYYYETTKSMKTDNRQIYIEDKRFWADWLLIQYVCNKSKQFFMTSSFSCSTASLFLFIVNFSSSISISLWVSDCTVPSHNGCALSFRVYCAITQWLCSAFTLSNLTHTSVNHYICISEGISDRHKVWVNFIISFQKGNIKYNQFKS